jgi:hypothetical protein
VSFEDITVELERTVTEHLRATNNLGKAPQKKLRPSWAGILCLRPTAIRMYIPVYQ